MRWLILFVFIVLFAGAAWFETQTSLLQSMLFTHWAGEMSYRLVHGPSPSIRFPIGGPYDARLGYTAIPQYVNALKQRGFAVTKQANMSPAMNRFAGRHGYALYDEKPAAGLQLRDRNGKLLYAASYPEQYYTDFNQIPSIVVGTLLFIENHTLMQTNHPYQNPAVEWQRFLHAAGNQIEGMIGRHAQTGGGSTLATQIEKYEHDPAGRTQGVFDKLLQMTAATTRAYMKGPNTIDARKRIVTNYVNSTPLSSRPGYGEVIGIADGLRVWFGTDFATANRVLSEPDSPKNLDQKAAIYKQVLSLMIAERRPAYFLLQNHDDLESETDTNLRLLGRAGVISPEFRDAALNIKLQYRVHAPAPAPVNYVGQKASNSIRTELLTALDATNLYALDRLDLNATTTIDEPVQQRVSRVLRGLRNPGQVNALGMMGYQLLGPSNNVAQVNYSVVIYEREADRNILRVHADTLDEPFDINTSSKLILGSTSKLRTLVAYLDILDHIYQQHLNDSPAQLRRAESDARDPLSRFVIGYMAANRKHNLKGLMEAAMQRRYSGSPGAFFTGSGLQVFHNFETAEDYQVFTVQDAFAHSVNLVFIRLMRDITTYYMDERAAHGKGVLEPLDPAQREDYLRRFADQEGTAFLNHFYKDLKGKNTQQILAFMLAKAGPTASHMAVIFRTLEPDASIQQLRQFLAAHSAPQDEKKILELYEDYGPDKMSLSDRGYVARVHPLELWLGNFLVNHPDATHAEVIDASADTRQEAYGWLFNSKRQHQQNVRIRIITEEDAFKDLLPEWKKQGWPFDKLVPSLATAIGSSGDRPDALATLMGIIVNNGVRRPTTNIEQLQLAGGTPYESDLGFAPSRGQRLYPPELISVVRKALEEVVQDGTARRLTGTYFNADSTPLSVGGKTGTSNNALEHFGAGAHLIGSEPKDRTATFVFFLGNRFYGTVTAFVRGKQSGRYHFTSALSVQLLKALAPQLQPLLGTPVNPNPLAKVSSAQGKAPVTDSD